MSQAFIYLLQDTRPGFEKKGYVGFTARLSERYKEHLQESKCTRKTKWIRKVVKETGGPPKMVVLSTCPGDTAGEMEIQTISNLKAQGYVLVNGTEGGEGGRSGPMSDEQRQKISVARKGMRFSESHKAALSKSHIGNTSRLGSRHNRKTKKKISENLKSQKGTWSSQRRQNMARKLTPEARKKLSEAIKDSWVKRRQNYGTNGRR